MPGRTSSSRSRAGVPERALAASGSNPLTLALLTQVHAFVFRDYERAKALIEPAIAMSPDSLMALDSLALLRFYTGDLSGAREAAARAVDAALHNPYRYCFATTLCMIETVEGDYESAIAHGERALAMHHPSSRAAYAPTLRYLSAAYENANRPEDAWRTYTLLKSQEPALEAARMNPADYPVPNPDAMKILATSFRRIESGTSGARPASEGACDALSARRARAARPRAPAPPARRRASRRGSRRRAR